VQISRHRPTSPDFNEIFTQSTGLRCDQHVPKLPKSDEWFLGGGWEDKSLTPSSSPKFYTRAPQNSLVGDIEVPKCMYGPTKFG